MPFKKSVKPKDFHNEGELRRKASEKEVLEKAINLLAEELKPQIVSIVERCFRRYCQGHRAPKELEELEWQRFKKILNGML